MSNQNLRAQQRAAAQEYYEDLEVRATRRARRTRTIAIFVAGAMILSFGAPVLFHFFSN